MKPQTINEVRTLQDAIVYFSEFENCFNFIASRRWPNGVTCPHCQSKKVGFLKTRNIFKCKNKECRKQFSLKTGTIMEDSPLGLDKWLCAIWLIVNAKNGISSCEVSRSLGVTQKTAWFLMHRIRLAMQTGTFEKLSNEVEADEGYVGGKARNMHRDRWEELKETKHQGTTIVLGAIERTSRKKVSQVRAKVIKDNDRKTLKKEVKSMVKKGSILYMDGHQGYDDLNAEYVRFVIGHAQKYVEGRIHTNGIENFWTLLKRSLKGTYVSVEPFHLHRYLDEQSFRYNFRDGNDQERFLQSMDLIGDRRITYKQLIGKVED